MKKIFLITDMEGVAGIQDLNNWCEPGSKYLEKGRELLTLEVNAAVSGFFEAGADYILVVDGHGAGGVTVDLLDSRVEYLKGSPGGWPFTLDESFYACAWVGQHAKAGTAYAHLPHTQWSPYIDLSVNGISIGEFGQMALCACEMGVRSIFGSGDLAFTNEAQALFPGIETVAVKRGLTPGNGDEVISEKYMSRNTAAIHTVPAKSRELIAQGAKKALLRAQKDEFGIIKIKPPYERIIKFRSVGGKEPFEVVDTHPNSIINLLNIPEPIL